MPMLADRQYTPIATHPPVHAHPPCRPQLTHADSMGNKESLGRGCVQYMSAGTGVTHSGGWWLGGGWWVVGGWSAVAGPRLTPGLSCRHCIEDMGAGGVGVTAAFLP